MNKKNSFLALIMVCTFLVACSDVQLETSKPQPAQSKVERENEIDVTNDDVENEPNQVIISENTAAQKSIKPEQGPTQDASKHSQENELPNLEKPPANASDFEEYLITNLSEDAYGGMYTDGYYETTFYVWVIDDVSVKAVIDSYPGTPCKVEKLEGNYSLKSLREYQRELYTIPYEQTNFALFGVEQRENLIVSTIPEDDSLGLKKLVDQKMIEANIPIDCVRFEIIKDFGYGVFA